MIMRTCARITKLGLLSFLNQLPWGYAMRLKTVDVLILLATFALMIMGPSSALGFTGFIENRGQLDEEVFYYAPGSVATIYFTRQAVVVDLKERAEVAGEDGHSRFGPPDCFGEELGFELPLQKGCAVWIRFEGGNPSPSIEARGELVTRYNYFLGSDPSEWQTNVPAFSEIIYHDLWPGIDLIYREERGEVIYEIVAAPGVDLERVRFGYEGANLLRRKVKRP